MRYIIVWRRSPSSRYLDVQLGGDDETIAVFDGTPGDIPAIDSEDELVAYINDTNTEQRAVEADLAHRILGWSIP